VRPLVQTPILPKKKEPTKQNKKDPEHMYINMYRTPKCTTSVPKYEGKDEVRSKQREGL
jgi:hypothetical protein